MKSFFDKTATLSRTPISLPWLPRANHVRAALALGCLLIAVPLQAQSPAPAPAVAPEPTPPADERPETVISSDELDMIGGDEANHFYFRGNVKVQATNMIATCDELEVISARQTDATKSNATDSAASATKATDNGEKREMSDTSSEGPNIGSIREIIMRGNVVIAQEGRRATAGIAYLYPQEGRVVLAENPLVTDAQGTLSGWRMELYRGERKVRILSNPEQRTRVTLPALQDLGYSELGESASESAEAAEGDAAKSSNEGTATEAAAGDKPATPPASQATTGETTQTDTDSTQEDDKAESAPTRRAGGWNPVRR